MKGLNSRDVRRLKKAFLEKLNEEADGNEEQCLDRVKIFEATELGGYDKSVVPYIVQELISEGLAAYCDTQEQVRITGEGKTRLTRSIESNMYAVLEVLTTEPTRDDSGVGYLTGQQIQGFTELTPSEINEAIDVLAEIGFVAPTRFLGTRPFTFYLVTITPRGRYEFQRIKQEQKGRLKEQASKPREPTAMSEPKNIMFPRTPVGSPFGFTDLDWENATQRIHDVSKLYVVFGYQFKSRYYDTQKLKKNIQCMFQNAVEQYIGSPSSLDTHLRLEFKNLAAGYGEHLFNKIAGDIISSDIAVFETSDYNPNVMIEMGVALTWGIRVLPIKKKNRPKPPSDISGQTWADYTFGGLKFLDEDHEGKLVRMIENAIQKKRTKL